MLVSRRLCNAWLVVASFFDATSRCRASSERAEQAPEQEA
jgi:hypothetical protein